MKTELHDASQKGESERLQHLLETGSYDVNEFDDPEEQVDQEREREGWRGVGFLSSFSSPHCGLCAMNNSGSVHCVGI